MADQELEALARALLASYHGQDRDAVLRRLGAFLQTEEGQRLRASLSPGSEDAARRAAQSALTGDAAGLRSSLGALLGTPEGAALAAAILGRGR